VLEFWYENMTKDGQEGIEVAGNFKEHKERFGRCDIQNGEDNSANP